ncbi:unnamed protein product, partial [Allacma fusca]
FRKRWAFLRNQRNISARTSLVALTHEKTMHDFTKSLFPLSTTLSNTPSG